MSKTIRTRAEIPAHYKWNAASVFASDEAWDAEADALLARLEEGKQMAGSVGKNATSVADALDASVVYSSAAIGNEIIYFKTLDNTLYGLQ